MPIERRTRAPAPSACSRAWKTMRIARAVVMLAGRMISSWCSGLAGVCSAAGVFVFVLVLVVLVLVMIDRSDVGIKSLRFSRMNGVL